MECMQNGLMLKSQLFTKTVIKNNQSGKKISDMGLTMPNWQLYILYG